MERPFSAGAIDNSAEGRREASQFAQLHIAAVLV